jgi:hypothetical protein
VANRADSESLEIETFGNVHFVTDLTGYVCPETFGLKVVQRFIDKIARFVVTWGKYA